MARATADSSDEQLVAAALSGDRDAFGLLVGRYEGRLVNYLFRLVRSSEDAHDLAQEVFKGLSGARPLRSPVPLLDLALSSGAECGHRPDPAPAGEAGIDEPREPRRRRGAQWISQLMARRPTATCNRERGEVIQSAVDSLPWEYRELILLRHYGELSYDEIATAKSMPLGTVKNKLFRARQMLKAAVRLLTDEGEVLRKPRSQNPYH
jgi:RNA polymerase sigma-70 factor (ECF subfamily)